MGGAGGSKQDWGEGARYWEVEVDVIKGSMLFECGKARLVVRLGGSGFANSCVAVSAPAFVVNRSASDSSVIDFP